MFNVVYGYIDKKKVPVGTFLKLEMWLESSEVEKAKEIDSRSDCHHDIIVPF